MGLDTKRGIDATRRDFVGSTAQCSMKPLMWMQWLQTVARKLPIMPPFSPLVSFSSSCKEFGDPKEDIQVCRADGCPPNAGRDRVEWEQRLQRGAQEASEGSPPSPLASYSSGYGESGDLDDPIQVTVAEQRKAESKGGWFSRAKRDRPKPARPTGVHGPSPHPGQIERRQ